MSNFDYDLVVVGSGPAGYVGAIRAAQLGLKVACVERYSSLGGTCLNVGCIPSKALLDSSWRVHELGALGVHGVKVSDIKVDVATMVARKVKVVDKLTDGIGFLFKKNKVTRLVGTASFKDPHTLLVAGDDEQTVTAERVLIATGSDSSTLPGIAIDKEVVCTSTEALSFTDAPKQLVVIGAGAIGLELGSVWSRLGSAVTVVEYMDQILPSADLDISTALLRALKKQGLSFQLGARVEGVDVTDGKAVVNISGKEPLMADKVLVATGRKPNTAGLNLQAIGVTTTERGFIPVHDDYQTAVAGVFAVGDVIGGAMLAHKASDEAVACVERMVNGYGHVNYRAVPQVVYTHPEVAQAGLTEQALKKSGADYKVGKFSFAANGRALAMGEGAGMVKVLADGQTDRLVGVQIVGPRAGDLIQEVVSVMEMSGSAEDLARIIHAHPGLGEAVKEAALAVDGRAIHA